MNKENERITYEEFMTMFKFAPRMCYTLYEKAEDEIEKLKKQKDNVVSEIKRVLDIWENKPNEIATLDLEEILRMLGEIDE